MAHKRDEAHDIMQHVLLYRMGKNSNWHWHLEPDPTLLVPPLQFQWQERRTSLANRRSLVLSGRGVQEKCNLSSIFLASTVFIQCLFYFEQSIVNHIGDLFTVTPARNIALLLLTAIKVQVDGTFQEVYKGHFCFGKGNICIE